jgi:hypothetical protein
LKCAGATLPFFDERSRMMKTAFAALALIASLGLIAAVGATPTKPFKIASTLDGKTVLPHRIQWLGMPTLPP